MKSPRVSVIGLGRLGSCYAAFLASRGFTVVGADVDQDKVGAINSGRAPVVEPDLGKLVAKNKARLSATNDTAAAAAKTQATFVIVPTPSTKDGSFSVEYVLSACKEIGKALRTKKGYHLVCLVSTVLPDDSRDKIIPALERASGKRCGKDFGYCYSPSLIAIGDVVHNLQHPDFLFLGARDHRSELALARLFARMYPKLVPERMSVESAEVAKIALNAFITNKITFANVLGEICAHVPNANVDHVTTALGKDSRIGSRYFRAGLGYGGPCFPRDNFAFAHAARRRGVKTPLALAVHKLNASFPKKIARVVEDLIKSKPRAVVGFLGISYKPRTTMTDDSQAYFIARTLMRKGRRVAVYEPLGNEEARRALGSRASYSRSLTALVAQSDIIFVSNQDKHFATLPAAVRHSKKKKLVIDPWGMFDQKAFGTLATYLPIGRNSTL